MDGPVQQQNRLTIPARMQWRQAASGPPPGNVGSLPDSPTEPGRIIQATSFPTLPLHMSSHRRPASLPMATGTDGPAFHGSRSVAPHRAVHNRWPLDQRFRQPDYARSDPSRCRSICPAQIRRRIARQAYHHLGTCSNPTNRQHAEGLYRDDKHGSSIMITNALLSAPIEGSIFGGNSKLLDRSTTIHYYNGTVNSYNILAIPGASFEITRSPPSEQSQQYRDQEQPPSPRGTAEPDNQQHARDMPPPTIPAPFFIETILLFDNPEILEFNKLDLGGVPLFITKGTPTLISFPHQPRFSVVREKNHWILQETDSSTSSKPKQNYRQPREYPRDRITRFPHLEPLSQLWRGPRRSITMYQIPRDKQFTIADQKVIFSSATFVDLFCVIVRKHEKNDIFVRSIALIAVPSPKQLER